MARYIFITGGVISSLGKGIASASIGAILEARGFKISLTKLDPYINVDPGTMSPYQHGEVYVTADGAETDLDMGHYERFVQFKANKDNNHTTGQVYESVIQKERRGDYLGGTVQVIPHITDEIKAAIKRGADDADIALIEIGGTVGDIESLPFLEAIRQLAIDLPADETAFVHLTLIPYIDTTGEFKTKPTQHSVKELRSIGIQPDVLLCRTGTELTASDRNKIALFTNVNKEAVISAIDVDNVYKIPLWYHQQGVDKILVEKLNLKDEEADLSAWEKVVADYENCRDSVTVGLICKYTQLQDAYKSIHIALTDAGVKHGVTVNVAYINAEDLERKGGTDLLADIDAVLIPGGFGERGIEGKINAAQYAREHDIPFLGICLGMQVAVIEFARNVAQMPGANSTEFNAQTEYPVIALITEWQDESGAVESRDEHSDKGGTMRLGEQTTRLESGSLAYSSYRQDTIVERHRHRYEFNNQYLNQLSSAGMEISGKSADGKLMEIIEIKDHPWFLGCQFHPEFTSTPRTAHPLFMGLILASKQRKSAQ